MAFINHRHSGLAEVREEICDDYVVLAQGDGFQLAEVLVEMAAGLRGSRQRLTIGTLGAIDEKPALEGRVERLIDLTRKAAPMTRMNRLAVVAAGAFGLVALAIVLATTIHAADEPPAAEPKASPTAAPIVALDAKEQQAVDAALAWITMRQNDDGGWSLDGQKPDRAAATSLAILPFLARGHNHKSPGPYREQISRGINFLITLIGDDGSALKDGETMYSQALVTMTLCRAYGRTRDPALEAPAQAAIDFIMDAQQTGGGWTYTPHGVRGDTSILGYQADALADGQAAGLRVKPEVWAGVTRHLDSVQGDADGSTYGYMAPEVKNPNTTAVGLLCRLRSGWKSGDRGVVLGVDKLLAEGPPRDIYHCYHANKLVHAATDADAWARWRARVADLLIESQVQKGIDAGSWRIEAKTEGKRVGYADLSGPFLKTSLAALILLETAIPVADETPAAEPKASAPPLGATEAKEPPAEAAAPSREPEQAVGQAAPLILTGVVVDKAGKPVPGAVVTARNHQATIQIEATAGDQGAFTLKLPMPPRAGASLIVSAADSDRSLLGFHRFPLQQPQLPGSDKYRIAIEPTRPAKVNVIDADGKPVEGAEVRMQLDLPISIGPSETDASGVATFQVPQSETIMSVIALKDHQGLDYEVYSLPQAQQGDQFAQRPEFPFAAGQTLILDGASPLAMRAEDGQGKPLPDVNSHVWLLRKEGRHDVMNLSFYIGLDQTTDASGSLTFAWFPKWQTEPVTIWSHATGYEYQRTNHLPTARSETVTVSMQRLIPLRGSVTLPDGKPAANIPVAAHGAGYSIDRCNASGKTDEAGRYEIFVAPNQTYMLTIADEQWAAPAQSGFVVLPEQEAPEHDFTLRPATRIHGRVLNRSTSQPVAGQLLYLNQQGISLNDIGKDLLPNPGNLNVWVCPNWQQGKTAGSDGGFEFFVAEGEYNLFTTGQTGERFVITEESEKEIDLRIDVAAPKVLTGIVTQADTQAPVSDALIVLYPSQTTSPFEQKATSTADGRFSIETKAGPAHAFVLDKKAGLGAIAEVGAEQTAVDLPLLKLGSAHGRLLTEDGSQPAAGVKLIYAVRITDPIDKTSLLRFGGEVTTDSDGTFTLPYLVPGWDYECDCNDYPGGAMLGVAKVNVQPGESQSLGDRTKPAAPKPYVPPTLEERTLAAFRATKTPLERLEKAKKRIQVGHNNLLIVWGNPDDARVKDLMRIRFEDKAFQAYNNDYSFMSVSTASDSLEAARELATALDMPQAPSATELLLAVLDKNGEVIARLASADFCAGGSIAKDLFFAELDKHKPTPLDAHELLKQALATAQRENKRVMLLETAAWCGPCQILSGWLQRNQQWEKDYVWVKIDQRWTGATEIMKELRGEDRSIPWVGILDAAGKPLATSDNPASGSNIGNPTTGPELDHFRHMFESTCQRMTPEEITELMKAAVVEVGR